MNAERLLQHFERISEAPDAIPRLRNFILDLAVRGKLVGQDRNDEPATALLCELRESKDRLQEEENIRGRQPVPRTESSELGFTVPDSWEFPAFDDVFVIVSGVTKGRNLAGRKTIELPYLRVANVQRGYLDLSAMKTIYIPEDELPRYILRHGDVLMTEGGDWDKLGRAAIWMGEITQCIHQNHVFRVRSPLPDKLCPKWVVTYTNSLLGRSYFENAAKQTTNLASINMTQLRGCPLPLPPLAEQHRIIAKVDALMALCDQLEAAKTEREQSRDRLVAASLHRLNFPADTAETNAPDLQTRQADAFRDHARFVFKHLPRLATRPEHIKQLRQTILNLAVRGRLSPTADRLEQPETLSAVALLQNGYAFKSEWFVSNGIRLLRNANVSHGMLCWDELACLPENRVREFERFLLSEGDVVLSLDRPFIVTGTKVARVRPQDMPCLLLQRVGRFQLNSDRLCPDYLFLWLNSPHFTNQIDPGRSNGVPHISSKQVEAAEIFVPPLAEQHRIVARVDELMALCDQLEAQLTTTEADSRRLLEAVLHEALNPLSEVTEQWGRLQVG